jgi:hypothetical protein
VATSLGYKSTRQSIEQFNVALRGCRSLRAGLAQIPVVVHVVYNRAEENISDAQIDSQIEVLNADFNATNPDVNKVHETAFDAYSEKSSISALISDALKCLWNDAGFQTALSRSHGLPFHESLLQ